MSDGPLPETLGRREQLVERACCIMGWEYQKHLVWTTLRKIAVAEGVAISLDKLEAMLDRLDLVAELADALRHLHDAQNGPPLLRDKDKQFWEDAIDRTQNALNKAEPLIRHLVCPHCWGFDKKVKPGTPCSECMAIISPHKEG